MGTAAEDTYEPSPVSPQDRTISYPETPMQVGEGSQPDFEQNTALNTIPDFQIPYQGSEIEHSPVLHHQTSQSFSTESPTASWRRFAVPTKNDALSSGFPFHPRLYDLKVTHDEWHQFSSDIVKAAKLSLTDDYLAWTAGITTGTVSSPFILVFGPWVGYLAGRSVHRKTVVKTVKEKLLQEGDLRSILRRWNEQTFMQKGFTAWLEVPRDPKELHSEYQIDETLQDKDPRRQKRAAKKAARRFRVIIIPNEDTQSSMGHSGGNVQGPAIPPLIEAATDEYRIPQELHDRPSEPPAYTDSKANPDVAPVTRSEPVEDVGAVELDSGSAAPVHYNRPAGFTNT